MIKLLLIPAILLLNVFHCFASGDRNAQWQKGVTFYTQKQYDSAAVYFERIAAPRPQNAEVYYNLGNIYYRLNKIAPSILNYERALRVRPDYKEAQENLVLARSRISNHIHTADDIFFVNWWQSVTRPDRATTWAILALAAFALIIVFIFIRRFRKNGSRIPVQMPGIFAFICICFMILAFSSAKNAQQHNSAVVMEADAPLMNKDLKGKPLALIPEGVTVKITDQKGNWLEVSLPDGRTGWLQLSDVEKI